MFDGHKLKHSKSLSGRLVVPIKAFKVNSGLRSLMTGYISCSQMRQMTIIWRPVSDSNHRAFRLSTEYNIAVVRSKTCGNGGAESCWRGILFFFHLQFTAVKHGPCLLTLKTRFQAFETKCLRKLLRISYLEHKTSN